MYVAWYIVQFVTRVFCYIDILVWLAQRAVAMADLVSELGENHTGESQNGGHDQLSCSESEDEASDHHCSGIGESNCSHAYTVKTLTLCPT